MPTWLSGAAVALLVLLPTRVVAQISGHVVTGEERPVSGARVEMWSASARLGATTTDGNGGFTFPAERAGGAAGLLVQHPGFLPARIAVSPGAQGVQIRLVEAPVMMDALTVRAPVAFSCPRRDDPEARALWEAAARRYSRATDTVSIRTAFEWYLGRGTREQIGDADPGRFQPGTVHGGALPRRVGPRTGYGYRLATSFDPMYAAWRYKELEDLDTPHFIDPTFGTYNTFSFASRGPDRVVLRFCSRGLERGAVGIEGTLSVAPDSTLAEASWRFRTPAPREETGGEVVFAPSTFAGGDPWLVPATSLVWRKELSRNEQYIYRVVRYREWR